jgi:Phytanoyl-CoA dioxygenase (PhyH)
MRGSGTGERLLSSAERDAFERDGFLLLSGALDARVLAELVAVAREEDERYRREPGVGSYHVLNLHDLVGRDPAWLELCDWETTFPKVWGILGWHIQLFHTQLIVTPPAPAGAGAGAYGWHQDNNRMNLDLETSPQPRISVKVGYFLTDVAAGGGSLWVVPGSHACGRPELGPTESPEGAREITARAGDAIIFDRRLWHAASTNISEAPRIFLTYGYSYRWLRPKSAMDHIDLFDGLDPIRRQLLGWSSSANGYFDPMDEDVPLRAWIAVHHPDRDG